jgi:hypothetical protein
VRSLQSRCGLSSERLRTCNCRFGELFPDCFDRSPRRRFLNSGKFSNLKIAFGRGGRGVGPFLRRP